MRKQIIILVALLCASFPAFSQNSVHEAAAQAAAAIQEVPEVKAAPAKPRYWDNSLRLDFGYTNTALTNWAAGGNNQTALSSAADAVANYKKGLMYWNNRLQLDFGFFASEDKPVIQKSKDRIYLDSKWGYKTLEKSPWSLAATFNFKSQFSPTRKYVKPSVEEATYDDWIAASTLQSDFLSPAYTDLSIGMDWQPKSWFSLNVSPLTGGFTIVRNKELRQKYSMDLKPEYEHYEGEIQDYMYRAARFELGAKMTMNAKVSINDKVKAETQLILFSDYLGDPLDLRVNWDNKITWSLSKRLSLALQTWLIYDPNVLIEGEKKVQFKEYLTINFTHTFVPRR